MSYKPIPLPRDIHSHAYSIKHFFFRGCSFSRLDQSLKASPLFLLLSVSLFALQSPKMIHTLPPPPNPFSNPITRPHPPLPLPAPEHKINSHHILKALLNTRFPESSRETREGRVGENGSVIRIEVGAMMDAVPSAVVAVVVVVVADAGSG